MQKSKFHRSVCAGTLSAALLLTALPWSRAAEPAMAVAMKLNSPWCVIGSEVKLVDGENKRVTPVAEQNRTLVPIRRILEAFGGRVRWVPETGGVLCSLEGLEVELRLGSKEAKVNGETVLLDVPAKAMNERTFVPVRFVSENLGLEVGYEPQNQIVVVADGELDPSALTALPQVKALVEQTKSRGEATRLDIKEYELPAGKVTAKIITVDTTDPRVQVLANIPDGRLNHTSSFSEICAASGAEAVINANYFEAYKEIKDPVGHVMVNGNFLYGSSGISSLGITASGEMRYGRPSLFFRVKTVDEGISQQWAGYEVNVRKQNRGQSVIYTPARGKSIDVVYPGAVLIVENGRTAAYRWVEVGECVNIPADGFVLYSSQEVTQTSYYREPEMGRQVVIEPYLFEEDPEGFTLDGVVTMISGAPRLVKDGAIETYLEPQYGRDQRFTTSTAPRTAVGTTKEGKLLLVSVPAATIQQMRELMFLLDCEDAINLDGGGSAAMYYKGETLTAPGRHLVTTLQIVVEE